MGTLHIPFPDREQKEGTAIINNNGLKIVTGNYTLDPKINKPLLRVSGVLEERFDDPTYYGN
jgi:hypothetical protein